MNFSSAGTLEVVNTFLILVKHVLTLILTVPQIGD